MTNEYEDLVKVYIQNINNALKDLPEEDILDIFKKLNAEERMFAKKLQSNHYGKKVYMDFIQKISDSRGGIKVAWPYFRARHTTFLNTVNKAIRDVQPQLMYDVQLNYQFCLFAIQALKARNEASKKTNEKFSEKKVKFLVDLEKILEKIKGFREEIINKHLYLSLHKAGMYKKSWVGGAAEFEDLIQLSNEALVIAVDKFVMNEDASNFHNMAIGRMVAHLISDGTQVSAAFMGEHAEKKVYRIRKLLQEQPMLSSTDVAKKLEIDETEVNDLMAATAYKSLDDNLSDDSDTRAIDIFVAQVSGMEGFEEVENNEVSNVLHESFKLLSLIERKVLQLKGIKLDENY